MGLIMLSYTKRQRKDILKKVKNDSTLLNPQLDILRASIEEDIKQLNILKKEIKTLSRSFLKKILLTQKLREINNGN